MSTSELKSAALKLLSKKTNRPEEQEALDKIDLDTINNNESNNNIISSKEDETNKEKQIVDSSYINQIADSISIINKSSDIQIPESENIEKEVGKIEEMPIIIQTNKGGEEVKNIIEESVINDKTTSSQTNKTEIIDSAKSTIPKPPMIGQDISNTPFQEKLLTPENSQQNEKISTIDLSEKNKQHANQKITFGQAKKEIEDFAKRIEEIEADIFKRYSIKISDFNYDNCFPEDFTVALIEEYFKDKKVPDNQKI